jgi:hypothetical protein
MSNRLIVLLSLICCSCNSIEKPICFDLKYKMSKVESEKRLSVEGGEFYLFKDGKDFVEYKKNSCIMTFFKQKDWLVAVRYEVFSKVSEANCSGPDAKCVE